jgi:hypothetical protein
MRVIAAELSSAGLDTRVYEGRDSTDITAVTRPRADRREMEVVIDDDSYCEIRFWLPPDATPARVAGVVTRAMNAITATPSFPLSDA